MLLCDAGIYISQNAMGDASLCLIGRRYEHVDKYFDDV